ncbi:hypothetical protein XENTR_v10002309 [Xenopus tropicalis]|nr:hypothetical protein XENTR_v10002309 [Xenopus tropicalis]
MRKSFSVSSSPPGTVHRTRLVSKSTSPAQPSACVPPPPPLPPIQSPAFIPHSPQQFPSWKAAGDDYQDLSRPLPLPHNKELSATRFLPPSPLKTLPPNKSFVSVGCQTDETPLFPPIQLISPQTCSPALFARPPPSPTLPDKSSGLVLVPSLWPHPEERHLTSNSDMFPSSSKCLAPSNDIPSIMAKGKSVSNSPPSNTPKPGSQLDNMLGSLQSDLNKLGVATVAKGVCGACKKPIAGQVVTAMGKTWHPEHFVCTHCQEEIGSRNFFERDGQPYCEKDYHNLFSPRCFYCNGPILDKVVTALDRTWHPEHFFCAQCGAFFGPEGFHERDGKAYCRKDYFDMFAPKCGGCTHAILENYISALNTLWHPECFVCRECFTPFINGSFFEHDGQPYCEMHYHERRGSLCSGCQKPITGRCITAMGKKFHPEHFVCAFCLKQLNKGTFKEQNDKPYCQNCFVKLFC